MQAFRMMVLGAALPVIAVTCASAELVPVDRERLVTQEVLQGYSLAVAPTGETLVIWGRNVSGHDDVVARLYPPDGSPGPEFPVTAYTTGDQNGSVAADGLGNFIVTWSDEARDGDGSGVFARRFDATGAPLGPDFAVNTYTTGHQGLASVAAAPDGRFVIAWGNPGRAQRFDASGTKVGPEILMPEPSARPVVAMDENANFVVASWDADFRTDVQRYAADGTPIGPLIDDAVTHLLPDIATLPDGAFVLTWSSGGTVSCEVMGRRYDASGVPIGPDFPVSTESEFPGCDAPNVVSDGIGGFFIAWSQAGARDGDLGGVFGQSYDASGNPDGTNVRINRVRAWNQAGPSLAADGNGNISALWSNGTQFSSPSEVSLVRFCRDDDPSCDRCLGFDDSLDIDADGIPDGCDPCTNVSGVQTMDEGVRIAIRHSDRPVLSQDDYYKGQVQASGHFSLAGAPGTFTTVDPSVEGAFLRFAAQDGVEVTSVTLPPGLYSGAGTAGWKQSADGRIWTYRDKTGVVLPETGALKLKIESRSTVSEPNLVRIAVKGRRGIYPLVADDDVIDMTLTIGAQAAADAGLCGETSFAPADCSFKAGAFDNKMRCSR